MKTSFIQYTLNFSNAIEENKELPFEEVEYPDILSEFGCGDITIFENEENGAFLHFENIELPHFALAFRFTIEELSQKNTGNGIVASLYQTYDLDLYRENEKLTIVSKTPENEKTIILDFEIFKENVKKFQINLLEDLMIGYSNLKKMPQFNQMQHDFS
jgi:hypothetical protein